MSLELVGFAASVALLAADLWLFWREMAGDKTTEGPEALRVGEPGALSDGSTSIRG